MPRCLQPVLQLFLKPLDFVTFERKHDCGLNQALLTQNLATQEALELTEGQFPIPRDVNRMKASKGKIFAQSNGKHYHYLASLKLKKRISKWKWNRLWARICIESKDEQSTDSGRLHTHTEWNQWIERLLDGGSTLDDNMKLITQKYGDIRRIAGFGAFGVVLLSHKKQECNPSIDRYYALKVFRRRPQQPESEYHRHISSEFSIASSLQHWNIVRAFELLPVGHGNLCECMEYCSGGDLYSLLVASGPLEKAEADCFFKQLMRGICYMHEMGIAHRDLKPENLLFSSRGCLKISDFGNAECFRFAWEEQVHMSNKRCGSGPYISPEQYRSGEFDPRSVDIWAAGIVYVAMRTGRHPWKIATDDDEFFMEYVEDCRVGRRNFIIEDICNVRFSTSSS
ncbi:kinase-like domain-containing protein [Aspergillus leporis]|uniref:non-specific serine/threonine protein kinase n=1 Tax=Aspergillus leporis TaxID=41062 RepID=A0A5N5WKL6_9EURO|nr:kinase-like domain-containing protein [Aspergillus leporis]